MPSPAEQLCLACGLCCDGTLFDNVRLKPGDVAAKLKSLGLPLATSRGQAPVTLFPQPCAALCRDRSCRVYADRPVQCAEFECRVLQDTEAGRIEFSAALRLVKKTRREADRIRDLLRLLGDTDEHRSLNDRFRQTQRRLESGADAKSAALFADLSQAIHTFHLLTHEKFHVRE